MQSTAASIDERPGFDRRMSADEINACPIAAWQGGITLVRDEAAAEKAFMVLQREDVLGFDIEIRPSFKKGESHPPSLVQLAGSGEVFIFQLARLRFPGLLRRILADPGIVKAGVGVGPDLEKLRELGEFEAAGFVDLGRLAREAGVRNRGLRGLAAVLLGFRISKGCQRSNWAREHLTAKQLRYAATDAWVGRELFLRFREMGFTGDELLSAAG